MLNTANLVRTIPWPVKTFFCTKIEMWPSCLGFTPPNTVYSSKTTLQHSKQSINYFFNFLILKNKKNFIFLLVLLLILNLDLPPIFHLRNGREKTICNGNSKKVIKDLSRSTIFLDFHNIQFR